jgi:hypothetical protein
MFDLKPVSGGFQFRFVHIAEGNQFGILYPSGNILRVLHPQPAKPNGTYPNFTHPNLLRPFLQTLP